MTTNPYQPPGTEKSLEDRPRSRKANRVLAIMLTQLWILVVSLLVMLYLTVLR